MNSWKLRSLLYRQHRTCSDLEKVLGISKTALYRKLKGETEFKRSEIQAMIDYFGLDEQQTQDIFFNDEVS